jgi:hypothetical protein
MKPMINSFPIVLILLAMVSLTSCEKKVAENGSGTAEFSISSLDELISSKSGTSDDSTRVVSYQIMISVEDMNGNAVITDKLIPLYVFGTGFVSENVEIKTGEFKLTKFMVINPAGEVVYAAPVAGSPLAYLVTKPLPITFNIFPNQVTKVLPEVLAVGDQTPDRFGYVSFGVQIIKPLEFWTMCVLDPGNPIIMAPIQITTAKLTVFAADGWHYTFKLEAAVNHLVIRGGSEIYTFVLEKEGFETQKLQFSARELMATTKENPLILKISWFSQYKVLVLQPGPEKGKDAMISNLNPEKNFGDYKYFETTFLSEPILTVMRSNRSLIAFNLDTLPKSAVIKKVVMRLSYDLPIPFDSTYITTNTGPTAGVAWYGAVLQQVVEPWEEYKVTWNTVPKAVEANQVYISPFIRNANSIEVDVTRLFVTPSTTDQAIYPNYGMLFRLWPVDRFPGFRFASSDYSNASMRPRLTIYYTIN